MDPYEEQIDEELPIEKMSDNVKNKIIKFDFQYIDSPSPQQRRSSVYNPGSFL